MDLIKTCKIHGVLSSENIIKQKSKLNKSGYQLRCRKCNNERTWRDGMKCKTHGKLGQDDIKSNGRCKRCHRASANAKRNNNREWFNTKMAEDKIKNPEKWKQRWKREYQNKVKNMGRAAINTKEIIRVKGLTQDRYDQMFEEQNHKCKICNNSETRKAIKSNGKMRLVVDHCHDTNIVRGLLCAKCNLMIGYANDSIDILEMAIIYLQEFTA